MTTRAQPYRLEWPLTDVQIEQLDQMLQELYDDNANGSLLIDAAQIAGILAVEHGGTGLSATGTAGYLLTSNGPGVQPTWQAPAPAGGGLSAADYPDMVGDTGTGGIKGAVPAPGAGDGAAGKVLKADGTWAGIGHNLLSATHPDTTPGAVAAGTLVVGAATAVVADSQRYWIDGAVFEGNIGGLDTGAVKYWCDGAVARAVSAPGVAAAWTVLPKGPVGTLLRATESGLAWASPTVIAGIAGAVSGEFAAGSEWTVAPYPANTSLVGRLVDRNDGQLFQESGWCADTAVGLTIPAGKEGWYIVWASATIHPTAYTGYIFLSLSSGAWAVDNGPTGGIVEAVTYVPFLPPWDAGLSRIGQPVSVMGLGYAAAGDQIFPYLSHTNPTSIKVTRTMFAWARIQ